MCNSKCYAADTLDIIPKDEKIIYLGCIGGHTSNPSRWRYIGLRHKLQTSRKRKSIRNHLLDHDKELR